MPCQIAATMMSGFLAAMSPTTTEASPVPVVRPMMQTADMSGMVGMAGFTVPRAIRSSSNHLRSLKTNAGRPSAVLPVSEKAAKSVRKDLSV